MMCRKGRGWLVGVLVVTSFASIPSSDAAEGRVLEFVVGADNVIPRYAEMHPGDTIRATFAERLWVHCHGGGQECFSGIREPGTTYEFVATSAAFSFGVPLESSFHGAHECSGACATLSHLGYPIPELVDPVPGGVYRTEIEGDLEATARVTLLFTRPSDAYKISFQDIYTKAPRFSLWPSAPGYQDGQDVVGVTLSLPNGFHRWRFWFSQGSYLSYTESVGYPVDVEFTVDGPDLKPPKILLSPPVRIAGRDPVMVGTTAMAGLGPMNISGAIDDDGTVTTVTATVEDLVAGGTRSIVLRCSDPVDGRILPCAPTPDRPLGPGIRRVIVYGLATGTGAYRLTVEAIDLAGRVSEYTRLVVAV